MKYLVLVGDGMADFPLDRHDNATPLELAPTPAMDEIVRRGALGLYSPIPEACPPGSDIGNLSLLGYDPAQAYTGRAPLEAASQHITLGDDEVAFRCNLVTLDDGVMRDFTSGHISSEEAAELIASLNDAFGDQPIRFHAGVSYRHLAVVTTTPASMPGLLSLSCTPPHDITGRPYADYLPQGDGSAEIRDFMERSCAPLAAHAVTAGRLAAGKLPATSIWLWGQGRPPSIEPYPQRFGLSGVAISAVDLVRGLGICAGFDAVEVPGATGYLDTNYEGKTQAAAKALETVDFVYLHVEAPDEAAHEGRVDLKVQAITDFDARVVAPCLDYAFSRGDVRILVAPDHVTSIASRTHAGGPVPFAMSGPGIEHNGGMCFTERAAAATGLSFAAGHELMPFFLGAAASASSGART